MRRGILLIAVVVVVAMSAPAKRLEILRHTSQVHTGDEALFVVRVAPRAENRALWMLAYDEDGFLVRQSLTQLDGENAAWTHWIRLTFPAGQMIVRAVLCESSCDKPAATATVQLRVLADP